jgi:hypothetical protein
MIDIPCVVDRSCLSMFSYTTSYMCVCQLVWLIYHFKVINSLMQDVEPQVTYKQTGRNCLFRTIRLQHTDHSFRYSVFLQLQSQHCARMFCKRTIFCVSYRQIHFLRSVIIGTKKVWTVTVMSPQLFRVNNCDLLLGHWPHNFHTHFSLH